MPNNKSYKPYYYPYNIPKSSTNGSNPEQASSSMDHQEQEKHFLVNASPNNAKCPSSASKDHNYSICTLDKVKKMSDKSSKELSPPNPASSSWTNSMHSYPKEVTVETPTPSWIE